MKEKEEDFLIQKFCKQCQQTFFDCSSCHQGQVYCCTNCRDEARRASVRRARARHQRTPEGREDHRDRNRALRARKRGVMD